MGTTPIQAGATSQIIEVLIRDTSGNPKTALAAASITYSYSRQVDGARSYGTCQSMTLGSWVSGGFVEIDATNHPGKYQFGVPNAMIATGSRKAILALSGTGIITKSEEVILTYYDPYTAVDANVTKIAGTSQTPKDLGALTITGGKVDVNDKTGFGLADGSISAAKFVADAITAIQNGLATLANQNTLLGRLTATRAGYLDALNISGVVASHSDVDAINQSASRRIILTTVGQFERPESGSTSFQIQASLYTADGALVNADTTPTLTATGITSGSLAANLGAATNPSTGIYRWTYSVASNATLEQIRFDISATIASDAQVLSCYAQVCDFVAATFTTADRDKLAAIDNKTTNLPSDPADESLIEAAITAAVSNLATSSSVAAVKAILDKLNTTIVLDGAVYKFTAKTLELAPTGGGSAPTAEEVAIAVVDQTLTGHTATDTVGNALATAGAGGIPPETQAQIDDILGLVTALQGTSVIHVPNPISADGSISMITAFDYKAANGLAIPFVNAQGSWPNLTGATCKVVNLKTREDLGGTVTVLTPTGVNQTIRWEIEDTTFPATQRNSTLNYILQATLAGSGNKIALATGTLILR